MVVILVCIFLLVFPVASSAQHSELLGKYRNMVLDYNQEMKVAGHNVSYSIEMQKSARADFFPKLSGNADFKYTGNPAELSVEIPGIGQTVGFEGNDTRYGASLTLAQPLYAGGAIRAGYDKARKESEMAVHESDRVENNIIYDADVRYWNCVASNELVDVAEDYRASVARLVEVVRQRVEVEYVDKNDLLMAEVRLNDADYQLLQAVNDAEVSRMSLNSFAGLPFDEHLSVDTAVVPIRSAVTFAGDVDTLMMNRPEMHIAANKVDIQRSASKISNSRYLPQLSVGIDGSYSSPGYDFRSDMDPNYAVYAKLSVPVFEWGKRRSTRRAGKYSVDMALEDLSSVADRMRLEIETAYYSYVQAVERVLVTENSLVKAAESEDRAMAQYAEGHVSIVEVLNAQIYHQQAKVNCIQSRLNAQIARSCYARAVGIIDNK